MGSSQVVVTFLLPFALISLNFLTIRLFDATSYTIGSVDSSFFYIVIPATLFGAFGEALGWRSFLQSSTQQKMSHFKSAILVGFIWGVWHIGHFGNGIFFMFFFLVFTISFSFVISHLIHRYHFNVYLATVFHFSANLGFYVFYRAHTNDVLMIIATASLWLIAAAIMHFLSYKYIQKNIT